MHYLLARMAINSTTQNTDRLFQVFQDLILPIFAIPPNSVILPTFNNLKFFLKSGQITKQSYKRHTPLFELNINSIYPEKKSKKT